MEMKICPVCSTRIQEWLPKCPYCDYEYPKQTYDVSGLDTKDKVQFELDRTNTNLERLEEDKKKLNTQRAETSKKHYKQAKITLIVAICIFVIGVIILPSLIQAISPKAQTLSNGVAGTSFVATLIGGSIFWVFSSFQKTDDKDFKKALVNNETSIREFMDKQTALINLLRQFVIAELCQQFSLSQYQIEYDLTPILNQHPELNEWWIDQEKIDVVVEALIRKYKRTYNELEKSDLQVENLKLQNESIAIDNIQKRFWTCTYCGNMNRADDMSCIKCGAIRPSLEE